MKAQAQKTMFDEEQRENEEQQKFIRTKRKEEQKSGENKKTICCIHNFTFSIMNFILDIVRANPFPMRLKHEWDLLQ